MYSVLWRVATHDQQYNSFVLAGKLFVIVYWQGDSAQFYEADLSNNFGTGPLCLKFTLINHWPSLLVVFKSALSIVLSFDVMLSFKVADLLDCGSLDLMHWVFIHFGSCYQVAKKEFVHNRLRLVWKPVEPASSSLICSMNTGSITEENCGSRHVSLL